MLAGKSSRAARAPPLHAALSAGACALAFALVAPDGLRAQVFLRGDVNADGRVSGSDVHAILAFVSLGSVEPRCLRSADVDRDNDVDAADASALLGFLVSGGDPPCAPFPQPGEDPASEVSCVAYDPSPPREEADFLLEVSEGIAGADGTTTLFVFAAHPIPVAGYFGTLAIDGGRFGGVSRVTDLTGTLADGVIEAHAVGGKLRFGFLSTSVGLGPIAASERRGVLEIQCCLESGLGAGDYEIRVEEAELVEFLQARAFRPRLVGGTLVVPDDVEDTGCTSVPEPPLVPRCGPSDTGDPPDGPPDGPPRAFVRGDASDDGPIDIGDAAFTLNHLFLGGPAPPCADAADANDDGTVNLGDAIRLLNYLFLGGPQPRPPFPQAGLDPTEDLLPGCFE